MIDADSCIIQAELYFINGSIYNKIIATNLGSGTVGNATIDSMIIVYGQNCVMINNTINYLEVLNSFSLFTMDGYDNVVTRLVGNAPITINGNNTFVRADFMEDVNIFSSNDVGVWGGNVFDSLYFNNPGKIVQLGANDTLVVNNDFQVNSNGSFPVTIQSTSPGIQATMSKALDTICVNYIYLQDIVGNGGAVFYAGDYSFDLGNNSGWSFTTCQQPISNVWPGDANYDLVANNMDILNIGLAYGETGFVRPGATISWQAEPCLDWLSQFIDTTNTKHADCDGNGIVDANDTVAVALNYSLVHPAYPIYQGDGRSITDLFIDYSAASINSGDMVSVPVKLGTSISPAVNVYGLAFSVIYDQNLIENGNIYVDYDSSWLVSSSNNVHLEKNFSAFGQLDIGFSRINHLNQSGNGTVATLNFMASTTNTGLLTFSLNNILGVDNTGTIIPLNPLSDSVTVLPAGTNINNALDYSEFSISPNPANDYIYIKYVLKSNDDATISITSMDGKEIKSIFILKTNKDINCQKIETSNLLPGMYFCTLITNNIKITNKLIIIK